jgi:peroxiredoxin Q/BCP
MAQAIPGEGDKAPGFTAPRDGGGTLTLADHAGGIVVLFFFPKADTSGCTKEAIGFTENGDAFAALGATVVGVSKDPIKAQDKFKEKHSLGVVLISDADTTICEDYGVWAEKSMYGKKYMGIERSTFIIDGDGIIRKAWRGVKVPGHVEEVLGAVKALKGA